MPKIPFLSRVVLCLLLTGIAMPQANLASDLTECMTEKIQQASDATTIGALRLECRRQLEDGTLNGTSTDQEQETSVASERVRQDKKNILVPFTLMAHKPNYILLGAHNTHGYDSALFQGAAMDQSLAADNTEAQFQLSVKFPLAVNLFHSMDVYAAYTNHSFWQVYNRENSSPFRETNHEPEAWLQFNPGWTLWGFTNTSNILGIVHQSNGRGGNLSRSWNRIFANFIVERGNLALGFKPWYRIQEDADDDDNRDITEFLGHGEIRAAYKYKEHVFSVMSRNSIESGFGNGALELSWSFPLLHYPYVKGYVQYFTGYGESLIDYNNYVNKIGIGLSLTDWL
jgi:phospholipase A1